jgi:hypothetical protein
MKFASRKRPGEGPIRPPLNRNAFETAKWFPRTHEEREAVAVLLVLLRETPELGAHLMRFLYHLAQSEGAE